MPLRISPNYGEIGDEGCSANAVPHSGIYEAVKSQSSKY